MLAKAQDVLVSLAIQEGFITQESLAIKAAHFEARDKPVASVKKEKPALKNGDGSQEDAMKKKSSINCSEMGNQEK